MANEVISFIHTITFDLTLTHAALCSDFNTLSLLYLKDEKIVGKPLEPSGQTFYGSLTRSKVRVD